MTLCLTDLVVGQLDAVRHGGDFSEGMTSVASSLRSREQELDDLWTKRDTDEFIRSAPSCVRMILEQSMATLLGRVDPIRFIAIYKGAKSPDFNMGEQNSSSLKWSQDIIPTSVKAKSGQHWTQEIIGKGLIRALLDGHLADYVFSEPHDIAKDAITDATASDEKLPQWLIDLTKKDKGEQVLSDVRKIAKDTYSSLSKGIHFEFFGEGESKPKKETITLAITDAINAITTTAIYIHFSDISINKIINDDAAITAFIALTKKFSTN